jgi:hypothetical protein
MHCSPIVKYFRREQAAAQFRIITELCARTRRTGERRRNKGNYRHWHIVCLSPSCSTPSLSQDVLSGQYGIAVGLSTGRLKIQGHSEYWELSG